MSVVVEIPAREVALSDRPAFVVEGHRFTQIIGVDGEGVRTDVEPGRVLLRDEVAALPVLGEFVETRTEELLFRVEGPEQWLAFSLGTGQRAIWAAVPPEERQAIYDEAAHMMNDARDVDGAVELGQQVRYSVARRD